MRVRESGSLLRRNGRVGWPNRFLRFKCCENTHIGYSDFQVGESDICKFPEFWFGSDESDVPIWRVGCSDICKIPVLKGMSDCPTL